MEIFKEAQRESGLTEAEIREALLASIQGKQLRRVLLLPPDYTRLHSNAGFITNVYYHQLRAWGCQVDILPAIGSHDPVSREQFADMFGDIPYEKMLVHDWRRDVVRLGEVPAGYLQKITEGIWRESIDVQVNRRLIEGDYDLILSIGQVVPHEVAGMSNHAKNIFVGVGGSAMIHKSHMAGALYGLERMMGKDQTPVRRIFDYALEHYLKDYPFLFVQTVTTAPEGRIHTHGLFISEKRTAFERAVALAQKKNIYFLEKKLQKCVVYLEPTEFQSTWLGNKSIYRLKMAMADGGELLILAPGVKKFGEDDQCDAIIRKYGYCGKEKVLEIYRDCEDLQENLGVAAHLIHSSSDGRFQVTYAVSRLTKEEIEQVGYRYASYEDMEKRYHPKRLSYGYNRLPDGEEIFYVPNPALGLWQ